MNPRNRHLLRTKYKGNIAEMPVERIVFSEQEAVGIGYYVATNPNSDPSLLVGSIDTGRLEGSRTEVAGQAFRMDGEFNVANRGMIELVEMFKADRHLLTTLLGLAQEQVIKMEKFGSIYADEVIIGHSNEGDFNTFAQDEHSEALKDRITAIQVPYNLRVSEDVKIYEKVMSKRQETGVSIAPLSLRIAATYAVLSRLHAPSRQGMTLLDKMRLYDGRMVGLYTRQDVIEMKLARDRRGHERDIAPIRDEPRRSRRELPRREVRDAAGGAGQPVAGDHGERQPGPGQQGGLHQPDYGHGERVQRSGRERRAAGISRLLR